MDSPYRYHQTVIGKMMNAYALHEIIVDENNTPVDYRFLEVNPAFKAFTGLKREAVIGRTIKEFNPDIVKDEVDWIRQYGEVALLDSTMSFESYSKGFGRYYAVHAYSPEKNFFVTIFQDISNLKRNEQELLLKKHELEHAVRQLVESERVLQQKDEENTALIEELHAQFDALAEREAQIQKIAYNDDLTGIFNRKGFEKELLRLDCGKTICAKASIILVSATNLKGIYDTYGLQFGDSVVREMVSRMMAETGSLATMGRVDGGTFALLYTDNVEDEDISAVMNRLIASLKQVVLVETLSIHLRISVGSAIYPFDCSTPHELFSCAMRALAKSTKAMHDTMVRCTPQMTLEFQRKKNIETQLAQALEREEFLLYYQPQFHNGTTSLRGFEALIRWDSPESGMVGPNYLLDRTFIARIDINANDANIAECIIHMASVQGMETIAEGVEKEVQQKMLERMGCSTVQGYHAGRPVPPDEIENQYVIVG